MEDDIRFLINDIKEYFNVVRESDREAIRVAH